MHLETFAGIAVLVLGLAALLPFARGQVRKASIDLLQKELEIEREARVAQELRCNEQIAELRGQLQVVNERFAIVIAREVVQVMRAEGVIP